MPDEKEKARPEKTADGRMIIWNVETGQRMERWPVDANAMLLTDEFTAVEPGNAVNTPENPNATPSPEKTPVRHAGVGDLPRTTPLGQPAVHSRAADATPAQTGPGEPKRTGPGEPTRTPKK